MIVFLRRTWIKEILVDRLIQWKKYRKQIKLLSPSGLRLKNSEEMSERFIHYSLKGNIQTDSFILK
jgi:hypothetical protein